MSLRNNLAAFCTLVALVGCSAQTAVETPVAVDPSNSVGTAQSSPEADADVNIRLVAAAEFAGELEKRRGKVVLIDMWASW